MWRRLKRSGAAAGRARQRRGQAGLRTWSSVAEGSRTVGSVAWIGGAPSAGRLGTARWRRAASLAGQRQGMRALSRTMRSRAEESRSAAAGGQRQTGAATKRGRRKPETRQASACNAKQPAGCASEHAEQLLHNNGGGGGCYNDRMDSGSAACRFRGRCSGAGASRPKAHAMARWRRGGACTVAAAGNSAAIRCAACRNNGVVRSGHGRYAERVVS